MARRAQSSLASYLIGMADRLQACRRVMKKTGSIYLHCDPTAGHYLKLLMDMIFGKRNYQSNIVWKRGVKAKGFQYAPRGFGTDTDFILHYTFDKSYTFNAQYVPLTEEELMEKFPHEDEYGRYAKRLNPIFNSKSMPPRPNLCYEYKGVRNPYPGGWRISKERLIRDEEQGRIGWENGKPYRKTLYPRLSWVFVRKLVDRH